MKPTPTPQARREKSRKTRASPNKKRKDERKIKKKKRKGEKEGERERVDRRDTREARLISKKPHCRRLKIRQRFFNATAPALFSTSVTATRSIGGHN